MTKINPALQIFKGLTVGSGRVSLLLLGTQEHGESRVRHMEALKGGETQNHGLVKTDTISFTASGKNTQRQDNKHIK